MSILRIEDVEQAASFPESMEMATENVWGYLLLLCLQESGHGSRIVRVSREQEPIEYRTEIDEGIRSHIADVDGVDYAPGFLDWAWYFQAPGPWISFWSRLADAMEPLLASEAPTPTENYQAMKQAVAALFADR